MLGNGSRSLRAGAPSQDERPFPNWLTTICFALRHPDEGGATSSGTSRRTWEHASSTSATVRAPTRCLSAPGVRNPQDRAQPSTAIEEKTVMSALLGFVKRGSYSRCTALPHEDRAVECAPHQPAGPEDRLRFAGPRRKRRRRVGGGVLTPWAVLALVLLPFGASIARADWPPDGVGLASYVPPGDSTAVTPRSPPMARAARSSPGRTSQRELRHLRPAGERERRGAVDHRRGAPVHCGAPVVSPDRTGWLGGRDRHLEGLSQRELLDIYAQRVSASGAVLWTTDGVPLCTAAN